MKRIMLACSAGMSTSLLVEKMKKAAKDKEIEVDIFAVAASEAVDIMNNNAKPIDILLLGPQIRFMKNEFEAKILNKNIPIDVIDMQNYGMMNGDAVLNKALEIIDK